MKASLRHGCGSRFPMRSRRRSGGCSMTATAWAAAWQTPAPRARRCATGDTTARRRLVVFGDSHAAMWMPAFVRFAVRHHWRLVPLIKPGCVPSVMGSGDCATWYDWALGQVRGVRPRAVVLSQSWSGWGDGGIAAVARELRDLALLTPRLIVIEDPPARDQPALDCLLALRACYRLLRVSRHAGRGSDVLVDATRGAGGARRLHVRTLQWFCARTLCPTVVGTMITYRDSTHITLTYARASPGRSPPRWPSQPAAEGSLRPAKPGCRKGEPPRRRRTDPLRLSSGRTGESHGDTLGPPDPPRWAEITKVDDQAETPRTNGMISVGLGPSGLGPELRICGRRFDSSRGHSVFKRDFRARSRPRRLRAAADQAGARLRPSASSRRPSRLAAASHSAPPPPGWTRGGGRLRAPRRPHGGWPRDVVSASSPLRRPACSCARHRRRAARTSRAQCSQRSQRGSSKVPTGPRGPRERSP